MVSIDAVIGYLALGYSAWQFASALTTSTSKSAHRFPCKPDYLRPSCVDALRNFFVTSHGLALFVHKWLPRYDQPPRGVVFLLHGMGEHAGRHDHVARTLAKNGFAVFAVDHQGHGRSDGERMFARKLLHLSEDFFEFVQYVLNGPSASDTVNKGVIDVELDAHGEVQWKDLPRFVLGHSMGGLMALQLVELSMKHSVVWNGVIVSAPALWAVPGGGCPTYVKVLASLLPRHKLPGFEFDLLSNDEDVYTRWARDPLKPNHGSTLHLACSLLCDGERLLSRDHSLARNFPAPLYLFHGEKDTLTLPQGTINFYTACNQQDKTLNIVPNAVHEVLNLEEGKKVLKEIMGWMGAHLK